MTTVCSHCGATNRLGSNFCNNCGTDLRDDESMPPSASDEKSTDQSVGQAAQRAADQLPPTSTSNDLQEGSDQEDAGDEALPPLFDLGLASPGAKAEKKLLAAQPWLTPEASKASQHGHEQDDEDASDRAGHGLTGSVSTPGTRLVAGVQGLLDPLNLTSAASGPPASVGLPRSAAVDFDLTSEQSRRIRRTMAGEPVQAAQMAASPSPQFPPLRIPWIFLLIGLAIALPVFGILTGPVGAPQAWPGVDEAYRAVGNLPYGADVLVYFAYDPATSGEMDMVSAPILRHLLAQRSNLTFVSLNPNGPASVRRLILGILPDQMTPTESSIAMQRITMRNYYLTGGAAVLPLLGQVSEGDYTASPSSATRIGGAAPHLKPDLAVVLAPRTEDVQHWLELVQPLDGTAVVAATAAGVDPMVRPYLDSGQLQGLVSGFDGAETYARLLGLAPSEEEQMATRVQKAAQNWGHFALLFVLVAGNVAAFYGRSSQRQGS